MKPTQVNKTMYKSPALELLIRSLITKPDTANHDVLVSFNLVSEERAGVNNE
jgi:hypothetical protein